MNPHQSAAALAAAGAPPNLVQFVTGYGEAGNALVTGGERGHAGAGCSGHLSRGLHHGVRGPHESQVVAARHVDAAASAP